jgi:hypothetical protein
VFIQRAKGSATLVPLIQETLQKIAEAGSREKAMGLDDSSNAGSSTGGSGRKTGSYDSDSDSDGDYGTTNLSKRAPKYGTSVFSTEEDSDEEQPDFMTHMKKQDEAAQKKEAPAPAAANNPVCDGTF